MIMRKKFWIVLVVVVLVGGALFVLSQRDSSEEPDEEEPPEASPVKTVQPEELTLPGERSYATTLQPWETAHISGSTGTLIDAVHVREGDHVSRGQLVAEMYDSELRQAEVEKRTARAELERSERLAEVGAVPGQQLEQAEAQYESASTTVELLGKNTRLTSPIGGVVTDKYFVAGEQFASTAETPSIVTVQQLDPLKAVVDVSERFWRNVDAGMEAVVRLDAHGSRSFDGVVERTLPTVRPDSRTFQVEIRIDNDDGKLSSGMSGRVRLNMGDISGMFIPRTAMRTEPGGDTHYVFVVDDEETARRIDVKPGERIEEYQQIVDGLDKDHQVVIEGAARLSDGASVQVVD